MRVLVRAEEGGPAVMLMPTPGLLLPGVRGAAPDRACCAVREGGVGDQGEDSDIVLAPGALAGCNVVVNPTGPGLQRKEALCRKAPR